MLEPVLASALNDNGAFVWDTAGSKPLRLCAYGIDNPQKATSADALNHRCVVGAARLRQQCHLVCSTVTSLPGKICLGDAQPG